MEGKPQWCKGVFAPFKHSRELQAQDVLRTRVEEGNAVVGFATESYDVAKDRETMKGTAVVALSVSKSKILAIFPGSKVHLP